MRTAELGVHLLAWTAFNPMVAHELTGWRPGEDTEFDSGQALVEFAGRACYQSWKKPNPATATNAGYIRHILEVGHFSVLEHGTVTFYLTGVSRSLTHELVRHRHLSYSQLSQRYVSGGETATVPPPLFADDPAALDILRQHQFVTDFAYAALTERAEEILSSRPHCPTCQGPAEETGPPHDRSWSCSACGKGLLLVNLRPTLTSTALRKASRQAARAVLPNAAETRIVVTGNYRAWRHFVGMRASEHADVEIRAVAVAVLRKLQTVAPHVFADFEIRTLDDGTEVAASMFQAADSYS